MGLLFFKKNISRFRKKDTHPFMYGLFIWWRQMNESDEIY